MITTVVKVQKKGVITIPWHLRTEAGIDLGDMLEASVQNGKLIYIRKASAISKTRSGAKTRPANPAKNKRGKK
jgi:AbrB family looped-hinge helix DNA binding protein